MTTYRMAILGAGNIGSSLATGLVKAGRYKAEEIVLTTRTKPRNTEGFGWTTDNREAVKNSDIIVIAVLPQQLNHLLETISPALDSSRHLLISVVSGVSCQDLKSHCGLGMQVVRAMPNTAIAIGESMTCIATDNATQKNIDLVESLFNTVGVTVHINEELMTSATALNACGIAFFLRAIRAASQGGVEIGFHAEDALRMAAQTAKGAASLLLERESHHESEIDKVTSPKGCTIAGLNEMEHQGFSSAMIRGIKTSAVKAAKLYEEED